MDYTNVFCETNGYVNAHASCVSKCICPFAVTRLSMSVPIIQVEFRHFSNVGAKVLRENFLNPCFVSCDS